MRIAAHIGVKDEIDFIGRCIAHLRGIGVSEFIVCDVDSTDGTAEFLEAQRSESFKVIHSSNADPGPDWVRRNSVAARNCRADWLVFADADEFLLPATGSLHSSLEGLQSDLISVSRYNVPVGPSGPVLPDDLTPDRYGDIDLIVEPLLDPPMQLRLNPELPWIRVVPGSKMIVRPGVIRELLEGGHDVVPPEGRAVRRTLAADIVTAHVPLSTESRFERKIENIRESFKYQDEYFGADLAWHWRRWLELADRGELQAEFERSRFSAEALAELRRSGVVRSAAEALAALPPAR